MEAHMQELTANFSDARVVDALVASYQSGSAWDKEFTVDKVRAFLKHHNGFDLLVFPGSEVTIDWLRDLAAAIPFNHPLLGCIPAGFHEGLEDIAELILPQLREPVIIAGHSLGAARAQQIAAIFGSRILISKIVVCGSPRPGCGRLAQLLSPYPLTNFKNRFDEVTNAPEPYLGFPAMQMRSFTMLDIKPADENLLDPFSDHHIGLYQIGVKLLEASQPA
ncbi:MAG: alpha/beta fold hydrolase [Thermoplasmata archaeon]